MDNDFVRSETRRLAEQLAAAKTPDELRTLVDALTPLLVAYWEVHPHSAMEMLEYSTLRLPLPMAHALVRTVVKAWMTKPTYDPDAGGNAAHCYLSALILSENLDLANRPWVDRVLPSTLAKELNCPRFDAMKDGKKREAIVRAVADSVGFKSDASGSDPRR